MSDDIKRELAELRLRTLDAALERYEGLQASLDRVEAGMNAWTLRHIANAFDGLAKLLEEDQA